MKKENQLRTSYVHNEVLFFSPYSEDLSNSMEGSRTSCSQKDLIRMVQRTSCLLNDQRKVRLFLVVMSSGARHSLI